MYNFYLGNLHFPVTPSRLDIRYGNQLQRIDTAVGGELVFHKSNGLAEVSFTALLPQIRYPFAVYRAGFVRGWLLLHRLLALRDSGKPVRFVILRRSPSGRIYAPTNINTLISHINSYEDAGEGSDIFADIKLVEYREVESGGLLQ